MLLDLLNHQRPDIGKIYLYNKDPLESKCRYYYSQTVDNIYGDLEDYNPTKKRGLFDDMIT